MNKSIVSHILFSTLVCLGFLKYFNVSVHNDYDIIVNEVKQVDKKLDTKLSQTDYALNIASKKKRNYASIVKENSKLYEYAWNTLKFPSFITHDIYNINIDHLYNQLSANYKKSINSQDSILKYNYMKMAMIDRNIFLADSLLNSKNITFTTDLITMNEPVEYKVGEEYSLYFKTIHLLDKKEYEYVIISQNGYKIKPDIFPLKYQYPQEKQLFRISDNGFHTHFINSYIETLNHSKSQNVKP